jgi:serpin B
MSRGLFLIGAGAVVGLLLARTTGFCQPQPPHERAPLTADQVTAVAGNNAFAIDLFHQLRTGDATNNLLVSPFSISTALAMTYAGARNRTAQQMADVLHFDGLPEDRFHAALGGLIMDLNVPRPGYEMAVVNRLWGQLGFPIKQPFLDTSSTSYGAPLETMDFVADPNVPRQQINDWVAEQTHDRIKDLLPPGSVTALTRLVLTNAVYFNGQWKYQFDPEETHDATFRISPVEQVQAPTMYQRAEFRYGSFEGFQMLEMPYAGDDMSMVVMLPTQVDGVADLESRLTIDLFQESVESLQEQEVDVYLPKFTYTNDVNLRGVLENMGMTDAFNASLADFDGIADRSLYDLYISGAFHKTFIDVNEEGTEAAAATGIIWGITSVPPPPPVFRADHPFLFALRDAHSGSLLFLGRLNEPEIATTSAVPPPLAGDFNEDGIVDAADYIVLRNNLGAVYSQADYDVWRANFGRVAGSGAEALSGMPAVPEPTTTFIIIVVAAALTLFRGPGRSGGCTNHHRADCLVAVHCHALK